MQIVSTTAWVRTVMIAMICLLLIGVDESAAQDVWNFEDLPYYELLKADPRAARMTLIVPAWAKAFPHSFEPGNRFVWQITLGREVPIVGWRTQSDDGRAGHGEWGVGLWIPVSFHMIEDHKDESAPIVDTDYRYGFMTKFQYGLTEESWLGIRLTPWAHESTHLGDEYTIIAQRDPAFERVNPSFEYPGVRRFVRANVWRVDGDRSPRRHQPPRRRWVLLRPFDRRPEPDSDAV